MYNPLHGVNWSDPFDYPYIVMVLASFFVIPLCIIGFVFGGWFVLVVWIVILCAVEPDEQQRYRDSMFRSTP